MSVEQRHRSGSLARALLWGPLCAKPRTLLIAALVTGAALFAMQLMGGQPSIYAAASTSYTFVLLPSGAIERPKPGAMLDETFWDARILLTSKPAGVIRRFDISVSASPRRPTVSPSTLGEASLFEILDLYLIDQQSVLGPRNDAAFLKMAAARRWTTSRVDLRDLVMSVALCFGAPLVVAVLGIGLRAGLANAYLRSPAGRAADGLCAGCGYPITGLQVCPECGAAVRSQ